METFEEFKTRVAKVAREESGYWEICTDDLREYYSRSDFQGAVEYVIVNTALWAGDF